MCLRMRYVRRVWLVFVVVVVVIVVGVVFDVAARIWWWWTTLLWPNNQNARVHTQRIESEQHQRAPVQHRNSSNTNGSRIVY